jgi:hypothetical protein
MLRRLHLPLVAALAVACGDDPPATTPNSDDPSVPTLTVSLGTGVVGSPSSNTPYPRGFTVAYSYNAQPGYRDLVVTLDGSPVASSGSFTMSGPRTLRVTATRAAVR